MPIRFTLITALFVACLVVGYRFNIDFVTFHRAAQWAHEQNDVGKIYSERAVTDGGRFYYGPISLVLLKPLGGLPYDRAKLIWLCLQVAAFFLFWWGLYSLYPYLLSSGWGWFLMFLTTINPVHNNFQSNNIQLMLMALLLLAEVFSRERSSVLQWLAGMIAMLAAAIKLFPAFVVLWYLVAKPRRVRVGVIVGLALILFIPFYSFGLTAGGELYRDFVTNLGRYHDDNSLLNKQDLLCLASLLARWLEPAKLSAQAFQLIFVSLAGLLTLLFLGVAWRKRDIPIDSRERVHLWALCLALMAFLNPSSLVHYIIFYVPAFCSIVEMMRDRKELRPGLLPGYVLAMLFIVFSMEGVTGKSLSKLLEHWSIPTVGFSILCVMLFVVLGLGTGERITGSRASS